ncbi:lysostaphin resistance A-like protein [Terriglobus sp. RCC_193]|uniref:CPBP family intramembrane glutamic endopeptidase n=1 Tax=Terriglobus sp. RCC_193 TaxID=3239218 RepID=UPI0035241D44
MTEPQPNEPSVAHDGFRPEDHFVIRSQTDEASSASAQHSDAFPNPAFTRLSDDVPQDLLTHQPRQPNLGYSAALLCIGVLVLFGVSVFIGLVGVVTHANLNVNSAAVPRASILIEAFTFLITYGIAYIAFPRFWQRSFGQVIHWNPAAMKEHVPQLIGIGIALSVVAQALESLLTLPKEMPVDAFFKQPSTLWIIAIFGTFVAPVCEEVFFRGFLLRGFAIFFDWIALPKTDEAREWWRSTSGLSQRSMILSGVVTSGLFAAMHAAQLGWAWNAVGVLWIVGGGLTYVRIRYNSVAASSVVHAAYNGLLFAIMFAITGGFRHLDKLANH